MAKLMVHRNILKSFSKLPSKVQKRVSELIEEFQHDPQSPAIGLHPLPGTMLDPKVRGVKKLPDGYRAIVIAPEKGDTYLLVHIDAHDKAYDWAKNKRFEVHGMNITGSAGTGKTVALMHRAVHLARQLEDGSARILVTTFTTNLSVTIKHHMQRLAPDVAGRIEVTNLHALARTICNRAGWKGRIAEDDELAQIWAEVWLSYSEELPLSKEEMQLEYELVIDPNGIDDEETYLGTVRSGRPRISRKQRKDAWPVFRAFQRGLKKRNLLTFEGAIHEARLAVLQGNFTRYAHVLVDEVQDFSLEALRLIRAISPIDEGTTDPLCTVGDGHQRIYRTKIPMSRAGINIRGRSRRLKINYRTSEQIRKFAQGILKGLEIDDLDGGIVTTVGDHSVFKGPEPMIEKCKTEKAEAEAIVAWVQMLMTDYGLATYEICVTPRKPKIVTALTSADIATFELKPREEDPGSDEAGIRMGTMKRIKGLEFRAVAMACAYKDDPMNQLDEADIRHRCERYVAATRAREHLLVTVSKLKSTSAKQLRS